MTESHAVAYAVVPKGDEERTPAELTAVPLVGDMEGAFREARPVGRVSAEWASILPGADQLTWKDDFFDDEEDDIVAVFDFDYAQMEQFNTQVGFTTYFCSLIYPPIFAIATLAMTPCFIRQNVEWSARSQHVAITRDGIRYVQQRRPTCWGMRCTDAGKRSKTVPFDQITDCDIVEPAGNTCCWIPNVLHTVHVDTASSGGGPGKGAGHYELTLQGLKNPIAFKKMVWAMKRAQKQQPTQQMLFQPHTTASGDNNDTALLLREIRDELRALRSANNNPGGEALRRRTNGEQQAPPHEVV